MSLLNGVVPECTVLGVRLATASRQDVLRALSRACAASGCATVATVNALFAELAVRDSEFASALRRSLFNVVDGAGMAWAIRRIAGISTEVCPGIELLEDIVSLSGSAGWRIGFLGGGDGCAAGARTALEQRYPGSRIWLPRRPGLRVNRRSLRANDELLAEIREARLDFLFVALGAPLQELWLQENLAASGAKIGIGVGGSFDVLSGRLSRAPKWMRRLGLEWLFRMSLQPARFRRTPALFRFVVRVLAEAKQSRLPAARRDAA
jgi:N-acetylglucosaminyldiphosphoundecaprenol N-acetyl-beta-D-mannosaminyltransferase